MPHPIQNRETQTVSSIADTDRIVSYVSDTDDTDDTIFGFINKNKNLSRITPRYGGGGSDPLRIVSYLPFPIEGYGDTVLCGTGTEVIP